MTKKIESWRLGLDDPEERWEGEINVTLNDYDLRIIVQALSTAEYEGTISNAERGCILDKLNIDIY